MRLKHALVVTATVSLLLVSSVATPATAFGAESAPQEQSLAIPISVLATFTLMYFQDLTLNIMTLGGLALGAGMLVDNAIVVIENIYRHLEAGSDARTAASRGAISRISSLSPTWTSRPKPKIPANETCR